MLLLRWRQNRSLGASPARTAGWSRIPRAPQTRERELDRFKGSSLHYDGRFEHAGIAVHAEKGHDFIERNLTIDK